MRNILFITVFLLVAVGFTSTSFAKKGGGGADKSDGDWNVVDNDMSSAVYLVMLVSVLLHLLKNLTVEGKIESKVGGFKFPDGTTQETAAVNEPSPDPITSLSDFPSSVAELIGVETGSWTTPLVGASNINDGDYDTYATCSMLNEAGNYDGGYITYDVGRMLNCGVITLKATVIDSRSYNSGCK